MASNPLDKVSLTEAQLATIAGGGSIVSGDDTFTADESTLYLTPDTSISYEAQTLTAEQQAQARTNIGAGAGISDVEVDSNSIISGGVANVNTINGDYNASSNKLATANDLYNPNLLINGDFKVNQRGLTTYTPSGSWTYCWDRWRFWNTNSSVNTSTKVVSLAQNDLLNQFVENYASLQGKKITLSCQLSSLSNTGGDLKLAINWNGGGEAVSITSTDTIFKVTATLPSSGLTELRCFIQNQNASNIDFVVNYMKLEIGEVATPFSPRPYAEELAMCQRYYQVFKSQGIRPYLYTSAPLVAFILPIPVTLRTTGTLTMGTGSGIQSLTGGSIDTNWTFSQLTPKCDNCIKIKAVPNGSQVPSDCNLNLQGVTELDAEIY